jgi:phosphoenolpyruvate carboxykinase (GTP)
MPRTVNPTLRTWVDSVAEYTTPDRVMYCDGSEAEIRGLEADMVADGTFLPLNPEKFPHSFLYRSNPSDVARSEHLTYICCRERADAGPTNNWMSPEDAERRVWPLFREVMRGRTLFVVPYVMGPADSRHARVGVEITDSAYVVASMRLMTRMGDVALSRLGDSPDFVRGLHSIGDFDPERRYVCHFPETRTVWSIGSSYGGNALLGKKCHGLRLAGVEARGAGWMAEHMLILGLTDPGGRKAYVAAAFPSKCGKTNLATLVPSLKGYEVETVGDDICWMHAGEDGRLWAINPENGMFGATRGTSLLKSPAAMNAISHDAIFTNVALAPDRTPWWEGMSSSPPEGLVDWKGEPWSPASEERAAHPNARFTITARQCPTVGTGIDDPRGVPISAILFGGRRATLMPLVLESTSWQHGVYLGATMLSETTAASSGPTGVPRNDPMAMLPFCGYDIGDYLAHWLEMGKRLARPPKIFHVNWFRRDGKGQYIWPGFGENVRVLRWILDRTRDEAPARPTVAGYVPPPGALPMAGLDLPKERIEELLDVSPLAWAEEAERHRTVLESLGPKVPEALFREHDALVRRIREEV